MEPPYVPPFEHVAAFMAEVVVTNDVTWGAPVRLALERLGEPFATRLDHEVDRRRNELLAAGWPPAVVADVEKLFASTPIGPTRAERVLRTLQALRRISPRSS